jgi:hypothetical protein
MDLQCLYNFLEPFLIGYAPLFPNSRPETSGYPCLTYKQLSDLPVRARKIIAGDLAIPEQVWQGSQ